MDERLLVRVHDLDRILDRDDVPLATAIDGVDQARHRRRLALARAAGDQDQSLATVSELRHAIAATVTRQAQIPQVTTFRTLDCTALDDFRRVLAVSPLPVIVAALCAIVRDHPLLNADWLEDMIEFAHRAGALPKHGSSGSGEFERG